MFHAGPRPRARRASHRSRSDSQKRKRGDRDTDAVGVTEDQYEQAREKGWDRDFPAGARLHVAGFSEGGLNVPDVWESPDAFQAERRSRSVEASTA